MEEIGNLVIRELWVSVIRSWDQFVKWRKVEMDTDTPLGQGKVVYDNDFECDVERMMWDYRSRGIWGVATVVTKLYHLRVYFEAFHNNGGKEYEFRAAIPDVIYRIRLIFGESKTPRDAIPLEISLRAILRVDNQRDRVMLMLNAWTGLRFPAIFKMRGMGPKTLKKDQLNNTNNGKLNWMIFTRDSKMDTWRMRFYVIGDKDHSRFVAVAVDQLPPPLESVCPVSQILKWCISNDLVRSKTDTLILLRDWCIWGDRAEKSWKNYVDGVTSSSTQSEERRRNMNAVFTTALRSEVGPNCSTNVSLYSFRKHIFCVGLKLPKQNLDLLQFSVGQNIGSLARKDYYQSVQCGSWVGSTLLNAHELEEPSFPEIDIQKCNSVSHLFSELERLNSKVYECTFDVGVSFYDDVSSNEDESATENGGITKETEGLEQVLRHTKKDSTSSVRVKLPKQLSKLRNCDLKYVENECGVRVDSRTWLRRLVDLRLSDEYKKWIATDEEWAMSLKKLTERVV